MLVYADSKKSQDGSAFVPCRTMLGERTLTLASDEGKESSRHCSDEPTETEVRGRDPPSELAGQKRLLQVGERVSEDMTLQTSYRRVSSYLFISQDFRLD